MEVCMYQHHWDKGPSATDMRLIISFLGHNTGPVRKHRKKKDAKPTSGCKHGVTALHLVVPFDDAASNMTLENIVNSSALLV
jgi:hypothetical protein